MLLEELLEQEKREQEREGGEWGCSPTLQGAVPAPVAPPPPAIPLYSGAPPPQPPPPPDRLVSEADHHARLLYEQWLKKFHAFATDQQRYYEAEVQKLRKIRKVSRSALSCRELVAFKTYAYRIDSTATRKRSIKSLSPMRSA